MCVCVNSIAYINLCCVSVVTCSLKIIFPLIQSTLHDVWHPDKDYGIPLEWSYHVRVASAWIADPISPLRSSFTALLPDRNIQSAVTPDPWTIILAAYSIMLLECSATQVKCTLRTDTGYLHVFLTPKARIHNHVLAFFTLQTKWTIRIKCAHVHVFLDLIRQMEIHDKDFPTVY